MKEYLLKLEDGSWVYQDHEWDEEPRYIDKVEIPEGAEYLVTCGNNKDYIFYKGQYNLVVGMDDGWDFVDGTFEEFQKEWPLSRTIWQRPTPNLEYLNPSDWSLHVINPENDAVPEDWVLVPDGADKFYVSKGGYHSCDFFLKKSDKFEYRYLNSKEWKEWPDLEDPDNLEQFVLNWQRHTQPEPLPFIDDESVQQTLNQRQQQYGDFEDVAETTEDLFQVLKGGASFVDLSKSQRMALYMICSKMARLVNGDVNHRDSWHDISGYSQLIDKKL